MPTITLTIHFGVYTFSNIELPRTKKNASYDGQVIDLHDLQSSNFTKAALFSATIQILAEITHKDFHNSIDIDQMKDELETALENVASLEAKCQHLQAELTSHRNHQPEQEEPKKSLAIKPKQIAWLSDRFMITVPKEEQAVLQFIVKNEREFHISFPREAYNNNRDRARRFMGYVQQQVNAQDGWEATFHTNFLKVKRVS